MYPTDSSGNCVNPYFTDEQRPEFIPTGWSAFLVVNAGHALGYLAWYELARSLKITRRRPKLRQAVAKIDPAKRKVGTLTRLHAKRMQLELLEVIPPPQVPGPPEDETIRKTAQAISISNMLSRWARPGSFP